VILIVTSCWIGIKIYNYSRIENLDKEASTKDLAILWFIGEACLVVGLIGTVSGFIIMLGSTFTNLEVGDITSMTNALTTMSIGMSAALYTTLMGLLSSLSIKVQLINLERTIQKI
jgi:biopolymer transport protein ExbB/TolQ